MNIIINIESKDDIKEQIYCRIQQENILQQQISWIRFRFAFYSDRMSNKQPPQPQRFQVYKELPDRSGFTITGCNYVFKFDRYKGWFDQYGNYYDQNGSATDPPSDEDNYSDRSRSKSKSNHSGDDYDEFQKEFGRPKNYEQDDYAPNLIHYGRVGTNLEALNSYPNNEPFRINFKNITYFSKKDEVYKFFKDKVRGILNLIFNHNEKGQFNGTGYFVVENFKAGEELIKLEGEKYGDREIKFDLQEVEHLLLDPLKPNELIPDFLAKNIQKKFYNSAIEKKEPTKPIQEVKKQTTKPIEETKKPSVKPTEEPKKLITKPVEEKKEPTKSNEVAKKQQSKHTEQQKKQTVQTKPKLETTSTKNQSNGQQFCQYKFVMVRFPKKSSFKEWVVENNFDHLVDVKAVDKIPGDQTHAKVTMKRKIYTKLNNTNYNGTKIVFTPL